MTAEELRNKLDEIIIKGNGDCVVSVSVVNGSVEVKGKGLLKIKNKSEEVDKIQIV